MWGHVASASNPDPVATVSRGSARTAESMASSGPAQNTRQKSSSNGSRPLAAMLESRVSKEIDKGLQSASLRLHLTLAKGR